MEKNFEIGLKKKQQYYIGFNDGQIPGFGLSSTNPVIFNLFVFALFILQQRFHLIPPTLRSAVWLHKAVYCCCT